MKCDSIECEKCGACYRNVKDDGKRTVIVDKSTGWSKADVCLDLAFRDKKIKQITFIFEKPRKELKK